jgi:hypothetical protein
MSLIATEPYDRAVAGERYTAEQVDAAVAALTADPERLGHAQELVTHAAPGLQRILNEALEAGGWFGSAHEDQVVKAAGGEDLSERMRAVRTLVAEETRIGMLVGVAVGFELARELARSTHEPEGD